MSTHLEDRNDISLALKPRHRAYRVHEIRLREMCSEPSAVLVHLKPQVPEVCNIDTMHVLGRGAVVHQVAHVMPNETPELEQQLAVG